MNGRPPRAPEPARASTTTADRTRFGHRGNAGARVRGAGVRPSRHPLPRIDGSHPRRFDPHPLTATGAAADAARHKRVTPGPWCRVVKMRHGTTPASRGTAAQAIDSTRRMEDEHLGAGESRQRRNDGPQRLSGPRCVPPPPSARAKARASARTATPGPTDPPGSAAAHAPTRKTDGHPTPSSAPAKDPGCARSATRAPAPPVPARATERRRTMNTNTRVRAGEGTGVSPNGGPGSGGSGTSGGPG